jgi:MFS family permease
MPATRATFRKKLLPWLVAVAFFMESLDTTILNTAVPVIAEALHVPLLSMKSVLASYTLSLAVFIRFLHDDQAPPSEAAAVPHMHAAD